MRQGIHGEEIRRQVASPQCLRAQVVRTPACHAGGRGFEFRRTIYELVSIRIKRLSINSESGGETVQRRS